MADREKPGGAERKKLRILKFLAAGPARVAPASGRKAGETVLLERNDRGTISAGLADLSALASGGLLCRTGDTVRLTATGLATARRASAVKNPYREQHGEVAPRRFDTADGWIVADVNMAESPLAQLARRKAKDGRPFLAETEWRSGERLRVDYTRARIMPRLGANWQAAIASGRRDGGAGGIAELTDAALAARQRVEHAVDAVGPELSGVLIDVCCFLKGLETVELERGWPARSAKFMLKSALGALSRHYERPKGEERRHRVLHWGTDDYRPRLHAGAE
jgi:hypothetical protein